MAQHVDLHTFLKSSDAFEDEPKPIDAWRTLLFTLEGLPVARDLPRLQGSPLHQWLEDVANTVDPVDLVETLDRELRCWCGPKDGLGFNLKQVLIPAAGQGTDTEWKPQSISPSSRC